MTRPAQAFACFFLSLRHRVVVEMDKNGAVLLRQMLSVFFLLFIDMLFFSSGPWECWFFCWLVVVRLLANCSGFQRMFGSG